MGLSRKLSDASELLCAPLAGKVGECAHLEHEFAAKDSQCPVYAVCVCNLTRIEHPGESWLIHSQNARQRFKREIALAASEYKRSLCRNVSRHSDTVFITSQRAGFWDELIIIDPSCNCF